MKLITEQFSFNFNSSDESCMHEGHISSRFSLQKGNALSNWLPSLDKHAAKHQVTILLHFYVNMHRVNHLHK